MNRLAFRLALCAGFSSICATPVRPASACGGCFHPPTETTVVTDHRMAFSISTQQTVLWDQIEYSGSPTDFSWVLPVRSGTVVQASSDAWFAALDAVTSPTITGPSRPCNGSGVGCGSSANASFAAEGTAGGGVQVVSQSVVGPYDTATLKATDPRALQDWLGAHGYVLPTSMEPTIAAYVSGGFDFIALRLQPGLGVQAMQPVRVVTQGADLTLPLRMVAAGVGAQVGVTLYVVGEGRYEAAPPFQNAVVDDSKLFWFHTQNRSNYQELSESLMAQNGGRTWLTEFSGAATLVPSGQGTCGRPGSYGGTSIADLYVSQCPCPTANGSDASLQLGLEPDASTDSPTDSSTDASTDDASTAPPPEASPEASRWRSWDSTCRACGSRASGRCCRSTRSPSTTSCFRPRARSRPSPAHTPRARTTTLRTPHAASTTAAARRALRSRAIRAATSERGPCASPSSRPSGGRDRAARSRSCRDRADARAGQNVEPIVMRARGSQPAPMTVLTIPAMSFG